MGKTTRKDRNPDSLLIKELRGHLKEESKRVREQALTILQLRQEIPKSFVWHSPDGRNLTPSEMDEEEIVITISYLQRSLVHDFGTVRLLGTLSNKVLALHEFLKEAKSQNVHV